MTLIRYPSIIRLALPYSFEPTESHFVHVAQLLLNGFLVLNPLDPWDAAFRGLYLKT
jgi:hypothetical protein